MSFSRPLSFLQRAYHSNRDRFGSYSVLPSSLAMTSYPVPHHVPTNIPRPPYVPNNFFSAGWGEHEQPEMVVDDDEPGERIMLGGREENAIRRVCRMAAKVLREASKLVKPGITTAHLDQAIHNMIIERGAYPSPLGYSRFPKSCTTSVNNVIVHGIPDDRPLHPQDIINIDLTLYHGGYHGDTSATFVLPEVDNQGQELVTATKEALDIGIRLCKPGIKYSEIGKAIEDFAKQHGFSVNTQVSGHGIGKRFHQPPWIFHGFNNEPGRMSPGECFTIEPCLVQGCKSRGNVWDDGWTLATETGARAAQFEHQVLITEDGVDILTIQ
ncbi:methionine aminopeptidase, type I [Cryptococcus depauperatus CBS 7841]|uniref:Methionine aminopeptidase n=1 Tax=Cryptococcus depauperatus CBS 7841 TaxID=1295531 RepID=A0A1E3II12_9TREE|nr:methionine aminopeptidase, type I [Cryptococcus depauperatus CBS 7841]